MLYIDYENCLSCVGCISICPETALYYDLRSLKVLPDLCTDCRFCVMICPVSALEIRKESA